MDQDLQFLIEKLALVQDGSLFGAIYDEKFAAELRAASSVTDRDAQASAIVELDLAMRDGDVHPSLAQKKAYWFLAANVAAQQHAFARALEWLHMCRMALPDDAKLSRVVTLAWQAQIAWMMVMLDEEKGFAWVTFHACHEAIVLVDALLTQTHSALQPGEWLTVRTKLTALQSQAYQSLYL